MTSQIAFWLSGLALAGLLVRGLTGHAQRWEIVLGSAVPVVTLAACLWSAASFGDFRLRFLSVAGPPTTWAEPLRIGGDSAGDDLVFQGLPPGLVRLARGEGARPQWAVDVGGEGSEGETGVVEAESADGSSTLIGSHNLLPGDEVCLAHCDRPDGIRLKLSADGRAMQRVGGPSAALPAFRGRPLARPLGFAIFPDTRAWPPGQGIYPLRDYGVPWLGVSPGARAPCAGRFLCLPADVQPGGGKPVRSFIYRTGTGTGGLRILLLDRGARLIRNGQVIDSRTDALYAVNLAQDVRDVRLLSVAYGEPFTDFVTSERPTSRLVSRGSLNLSIGDVWTLALGRPAVIPIRRPDIDEAKTKLRRGETAVPINLLGAARPTAGSFAPNPLRVEAIGGRLSDTVDARLLLERDTGFGLSGNRFALTGNKTPVALGERFAVGSEPARPVANFRLERLDAPWLAVAVALFSALLLALGCLDRWSEHRPTFLIIACAQWMLALRLLIGIESAAFDPRLSFADAIGGNIAAFAALPLLLAAASAPERGARFSLWPAMLFCAGTLVLVWQWYGSNAGLQVSTLALGITLLLWLPEALVSRVRPLAGASWLLPATAALGLVFVLLVAWRSGWLYGLGLFGVWAVALLCWIKRDWIRGQFADDPLRAWAVLIGLAILARMLMLLGGVSERLTWSVNVSIIYVPLLLLSFTGLFAAILKRGENAGIWLGVGAFALLGGAFVAIPLLVGDLGLAIYTVPILAFGAFLGLRLPGAAKRRWTGGWLALPAVVMVLAGAYLTYELSQSRNWEQRLAAAVAESKDPDPAIHDAAGNSVAVLLAEVNGDDRNKLRLWTAFAPDRVASAGTSAAESQRRVAQILAAYTDEPMGRGYLSPSDPADIRAYQADDNLSAVHLMSPFGRIGAAIFLLVTGLLAWRAGRAAQAGETASLAAALALWTVFAAGAYMVLANLQLIPFTGRNVYLLAALSRSDLVEGSVLMVIALRGMMQRN